MVERISAESSSLSDDAPLHSCGCALWRHLPIDEVASHTTCLKRKCGVANTRILPFPIAPLS